VAGSATSWRRCNPRAGRSGQTLYGFFAEWASNLALLLPEFVERIYQSEAARISKQFASNEWVLYKVYDLAQCNVGPCSLWIKKQVIGWSVELRHPCDVDPRILTIQKMPVLCPEVDLARKLALACYPNEVAGLIWHPYS
jgi:hypothetical protein